MSYFNSLKPAQPDPIFGLSHELKNDPRPHKTDLLIGYYRNEACTTPVFESIKKAQFLLLKNQTDLTYFPIDGLKNYLDALKGLIFEPSCHDALIASQTVGGTSALHHLGHLIRLKGHQRIAIPEPTWANHRQIFEYLGLQVVSYPYYTTQTQTLDFDRLTQALETLPNETCILFHASCHNPSGVDLSSAQWELLADLVLRKKHLPFFDAAYQGLGTSLTRDVTSVNIFAKKVPELFLAYSCSKNFGLYGERTGALFIYAQNPAIRQILLSLVKQSQRATYSNPPRQGAELVCEVLKSTSLRKEWEDELSAYRKRISTLRSQYADFLERHTHKDFSYVRHGQGLFCYTGLNKQAIAELKEKQAIYLASDGRINLTGLNEKNFSFIMELLKRYL